VPLHRFAKRRQTKIRSARFSDRATTLWQRSFNRKPREGFAKKGGAEKAAGYPEKKVRFETKGLGSRRKKKVITPYKKELPTESSYWSKKKESKRGKTRRWRRATISKPRQRSAAILNGGRHKKKRRRERSKVPVARKKASAVNGKRISIEMSYRERSMN